MDIIRGILRFFIRTFSFFRKEVAEFLRQPRLMLTLVLGPFLILLLFGIGFRYVNPPIDALFVASEDNELRGQIEQYATSLGPQLIFAGVTESEAAARSQLRRGLVDVIVIAPDNVYETVRNNQQPIFDIYHNEIDPLQDNYIRFVGRIYVDEVNRRILNQVTVEGQAEAAEAETELQQVRATVDALQEAVQGGNEAAVETQLQQLDHETLAWAVAAQAALQVFDAAQETAGGNPGNNPNTVFEEIRQNMDALQETQAQGNEQISQRLNELDEDLTAVESRLQEFQQTDPAILVSLFGAETRSITNFQPSFSEYYTPAVIALLLQHLCVTFGALSIVSERSLGTMELFKVAPLSALEMLLGKYASFMTFSALITAAVTALVIFIMGVPMLGSWHEYALVVIALIFAALGVGFLISMLSDRVSQAVQFSMIFLLASVFFTGFFQDIDLFWAPVRTVSWMLPATYGIRLLQNIMLRGQLSPTSWLLVLTAIGIFLFAVAWLLLRRGMVSR